MTYRNDHEAALARAAALEQQLADAREEAAEKSEQLAEVEREKARLERELARARAAPPIAPAAKPIEPDPTATEAPSSRPPGMLGLGLFGLVLLAGILVCAKKQRQPAPPVEIDHELMRRIAEQSMNPTCHLRSEPAGATIRLVWRELDDRSGATMSRELGTAPVSIKRDEIASLERLDSRLEASLPGYATTHVPMKYMDRCPSTIELVRVR